MGTYNHEQNVENIEGIEKQKSIFSFFSKFLSKNKKIVMTEDPNANNKVIGKNEPTVNEKTLQTIIDYISKSKADNLTQMKGSSTSVSNFAPIFETKKQKVVAWKTMYQYPEINRATNIIINEALARDEQGQILKLNIRQNGTEEVPMAVQEIMNSAFNILCHDIYDIENNIHNFFKKFLIEGELYIELISDELKQTIVGFNVLPSYSMIPIFQQNTNNIIGYTQYEDVIINNIDTDDNKKSNYDPIMGIDNRVYLGNDSFGVTGMMGVPIEFLSNQVAYANYGSYNSNIYDVDGYYSPIRKTYNQLSVVDDALAIYRFVRAPETRLWNIYTGNLPPTKVDNYIQDVITEFRKDFNYNPGTGEITQDTAFNSIIDDYFFAADGSGNKTSVDTLSGAMNLDQLNDVQYYREKLYTGLHIPKSFYDPSAEVTIGATRDSVRPDEMELTYFVEGLQNNFVQIFSGPFETLLRIMGVDEKYINKKYYSIEFAKRNSWQFWQDNVKLNAQITAYTAMQAHIFHPTDNVRGIFAPKFAMVKCFDLSQNELQVNADMLEEYKKTFEPKPTNQENWEPGVPEYEDEFEYENNFVYGLGSISPDTFQYGQEDKFEYGSEIVKPKAKVEPTDLRSSLGEFAYGSDFSYGEEEEPEVTPEEDLRSALNDFAYGREYLYGLEKEKELEQMGSILDEIEFETLGAKEIPAEDYITGEDLYDFGKAYTYGSEEPGEYQYGKSENPSIEQIAEVSPEVYSYGKNFNYGIE
jgi:hypothetical protein